MLPDNCLAVNTSCGAHQCHRIVASREPAVIGDICACFVTCSNLHNQQKLRAALWAILDGDEFAYFVGAPSEEWLARNGWVVEHTLLRSANQHAGCSDAWDAVPPLEWDTQSSAAAFFTAWNGDWLQSRISYYDTTGELGKEGAKHLLYSTAIDADLLMGSDVNQPCVDDWGTCGASGGRMALGMLVHDVLWRCIQRAVSGWVLPPQDRRQVDGGADQRERVRKKGWRTQKVMGNPEKRQTILTYVFVGEHIEHLTQTLQYLDEMRQLLRLRPLCLLP